MKKSPVSMLAEWPSLANPGLELPLGLLKQGFETIKVLAGCAVRDLLGCLPFLTRTDVLEHSDIVLARYTHPQLH